MLSAASQLSLKGAIETMLTWTGSKTSRPAAPEDITLQKSRGIFSVIVTPDSIPKFCIPSLEVRHFAPVGDAQDQRLGSPLPGKMIKRPRSTRSKSELYVRKEGVPRQETQYRNETLCSTDAILPNEHLERAEDHSDPVMRVALSLPHLPKVTTPYGFLTLGESPSIRRKESLFFGYGSAELRILLSQKKTTTCSSYHLASPLTLHNQSRSWETSSWETSSTRSSWPARLCTKQTPSSSHCSPCSKKCTNKSERKRLQSLMKKHLPSIRRLRLNSASGERLVIQSKRSLKSPVS